MKLCSLILFAAAILRTASAEALLSEESKIKEVLVEANELDFSEVVSESSVVYPQNLTFPAPKTHSGIGSDLGEPQQMDADHEAEIYQKLEEARKYVEEEVQNNEKLSSIAHLCKNQHASCAFWSVIGECDNNPAVRFMEIEMDSQSNDHSIH